MLAEAARITDEHGRRYAGRIPLQKADSRPHGGSSGASDYVLHAHLVSAPPDIDDQLNGKLAELLDRYNGEPSDALDPADKVERGYNFRDYWLHGEGLTRWTTWPELTEKLKKFLPPAPAKRIAREWFHERYGVMPDEVV